MRPAACNRSARAPGDSSPGTTSSTSRPDPGPLVEGYTRSRPTRGATSRAAPPYASHPSARGSLFLARSDAEPTPPAGAPPGRLGMRLVDLAFFVRGLFFAVIFRTADGGRERPAT